MASDADFATAVAFVLQEETGGDPTGALHTDASDPGGTTKWGISQREYPTLDVASLTRDDAVSIYYRDYWEESGAPNLPMPLAFVHFDTYVNMLPATAERILEESGGDVNRYLALRAQEYQAIAEANPTLAKFLNGWLNRVKNLAGAIGPAAGIGAAVLILLGVIAWLALRAHKSAPA